MQGRQRAVQASKSRMILILSTSATAWPLRCAVLHIVHHCACIGATQGQHNPCHRSGYQRHARAACKGFHHCSTSIGSPTRKNAPAAPAATPSASTACSARCMPKHAPSSCRWMHARVLRGSLSGDAAPVCGWRLMILQREQWPQKSNSSAPMRMRRQPSSSQGSSPSMTMLGRKRRMGT